MKLAFLPLLFCTHSKNLLSSCDPKNNLCEDLNSAKITKNDETLLGVNLKNNRNFHCHGWSQKAEFIDNKNNAEHS